MRQKAIFKGTVTRRALPRKTGDETRVKITGGVLKGQGAPRRGDAKEGKKDLTSPEHNPLLR
ncbi:MAG: hypothetical protein Kow0025_21030 [Thermodesulfovibrionales bacterium]